MIVQHLKAPNDRNGNPRRLWAVYGSDSGNLVELIEEGYAGRPDVCDDWRNPDVVEIPEINITAGEYNAWKKYAKERHIYSPR